MNEIVFSLLLVISMMILPVYGQSNIDFGYTLQPSKLLENTEGILEVYVVSGDLMIPMPINDLKIITSDSSVIKILDINSKKFITEIKIQALKPGTANIALAAPDYFSKEIPITVYTNNNYPTQILAKLTPNDFPVDGPKFGYIAVELATTGGLPTKAVQDTIVRLSTPNTDVLELADKELEIKEGEYYAVGKFLVKDSGDAIIFIETPGMKRISEFVHVRKASEPLGVQLYMLPSTVNSMSNSHGYAIVQLQDAEGVPVKAEKDIPIRITVTNPDAEINISNDFEELLFDTKIITIKEGSYWAYSAFGPRPDYAQFVDDSSITLEVNPSTEGYISSGDTVKIVHEEALIGKGPAVLETLPILTTGQRELIGVVHLESTLPVMASEDLLVRIDSSNLETIKVDKVKIGKGQNAGLVFGKTGTMIPAEGETLELYTTDEGGTTVYTAIPEGPEEENLALQIEPLIPKVLANTNFPVLAYLLETEDEETVSSDDGEEEDGRIGVTHFIKDSILTFSANEFVDIEPEIIKQNQPYALIYAKSTKVGTTSLSSKTSGFDSSLSVTSLTTDPAKIHFSFPNTLLPQTKSLVAIQLLDSGDNPVYAKEDTVIEIVSKDQKIIDVPDTVIIKKDDYHTFMEMIAENEGKTEIATLSEDLPLSKFNMEVNGLHPEVSLNTVNSANIDEEIAARVHISFPGLSIPLSGYNVKWETNGAEIRQIDSLTNNQGEADVVLISSQPTELDLKVIVSGEGFSDTTVNRKISIIEPVVELRDSAKSSASEFEFSNSNMIFFIIPGAAAGAFFFLKRTNRLEEIKEKLNIGDFAASEIMEKLNFRDFGEKISSIKEKISEVRER